MKQSIFVTGLFRSGTTWLARALNSHPEISFESDPIAPIFNSFRYDLANNKYKKKNHRFSPLEDYFDSNTDLLKSILNSDFKKILNKDAGKKIFKLIKKKIYLLKMVTGLHHLKASIIAKTILRLLKKPCNI